MAGQRASQTVRTGRATESLPIVACGLDDRRLVVQIMTFPNMLEELAAMYNDGLLDPKIVKMAVEAEADNFWDRATWWLEEIRSPDNGVFDDLKVMIEKLDEVKRARPLQS
jgi:hypothetical protein